MKQSLLFLFAALLPLVGTCELLSPEDALSNLQEAIEDPSIDFEKAYKTAETLGVSESSLIESRLIKYLGEGQLGALVQMVPTLESMIDTWEYSPGKLFSYKAQLISMIHSLKAVAAQYSMDYEAFEYHSKEAFWNSPEMTSIFSLPSLVQKHQNRVYQNAMLESMIVPMDTEIIDLEGNYAKLSELVEGQRAILIDFWASWCGPCMKLMPSLKEKAAVLIPQGITVVGLNTDQTEALEKASKVKAQFKMEMPWYVEPASGPLSKMLFVDSIPRMVLISPEGEILFTGHPMDAELLAALESLEIDL